MPNTRRKVVNSKYILLLLFLGACLLLMGLSQLMRMAYTNAINFEAFWSMMGLLAAVGLISPCLMMPVIFRFGTEKGRLFYYFLVGFFGCSVCDCGETGSRDFPHRSIADVDSGGDFGGGLRYCLSFLGGFPSVFMKKGNSELSDSTDVRNRVAFAALF